MFEQTFKNIDDVLWKEAGCTTELDYTEQTSWLLFLKYLDDLEQERALEAELVGKPYDFILDEPYQWSTWAAPKKADGVLDHDNALIGDDLIEFVNDELFPFLRGFKRRATSPDTIEYKIGEISSEIKNRFQSGYSFRDALASSCMSRSVNAIAANPASQRVARNRGVHLRGLRFGLGREIGSAIVLLEKVHPSFA
jgi:type I restriction enzyme M protein